jgi:hypothetical protein
MEHFSLNTTLLRDIFSYAKPLGHNERPDNLNLGFGFLYYGMVRALRPRHILVIGSGFGFSVVCLALGLKDNGAGMLTFVDPGYSLVKDGPFKTVGGTGKWADEGSVTGHFARFGVEDVVTHYKQRSDEFFPRYAEYNLPTIDLAFIDGSHAYKDVKHDFLGVAGHVRRHSYVFLHDTHIYVRELVRHAGVKRWMKILKKEEEYFEVIDFPFSSGVAMVHVLQDKAWEHVK